jgi:hypothetical protein
MRPITHEELIKWLLEDQKTLSIFTVEEDPGIDKIALIYYNAVWY